MHIFWHNDGVSLRPDNEQEHRALVLLFENVKVGWPPELISCVSGEQAQDDLISHHEFAGGPRRVIGDFVDR